MESKKKLRPQRTLHDKDEKARVLRQYAGIFPNNIVEFGQFLTKRHKPSKNYSR